MSIQAQCREAMHKLAAEGEMFTEIDVANEASSEAWSNKHFDQAVKFAYNVLQGDYKQGRLVRFGPVEFQGTKDYARRGTKILYTDAKKGPKKLVTPNGTFPRLLAENDALSAPGRRAGTNRDDTKSWDMQNVTTLKRSTPKSGSIDPAPLLKKINELESEVNRLRKSQPEDAPSENIDMLAEALLDRLTERVTENVKESFAEALIA